MIKNFEEFINEGNENFILYVRDNEHQLPQDLKKNMENIIKKGEEDNKTVLTKHNSDAFIWGHEAFLYPFFSKDEAEKYVRELGDIVDIFDYNIFPATDNNPLMKYLLK